MKRILCLLVGFVICSASLVFAKDAARAVSQGNKLYKEDKFDQALKLYDEAIIDKPDSAIVNFNKGAAYFKKEDFDTAISSFEKALLSEDKLLESRTNYNIGNAKYALGKLKENADPASCAKLLGQALDYYKRALDLNPQDEDAKFNYELAEEELKAILDKLKARKDQQAKEEKSTDKKEDKNGSQSQNGKEGRAEAPRENKEAESKAGEGQEEKEDKADSQTEEGQKKEEAGGKQQKSGQKEEPARGTQDLKEMSLAEARMLLEGYSQQAIPGSQVKDKEKIYSRQVDKDW